MPRSLVSLLGSPARAGSVIADLQKASILMGFCDLVSSFCEMKKAVVGLQDEPEAGGTT